MPSQCASGLTRLGEVHVHVHVHACTHTLQKYTHKPAVTGEKHHIDNPTVSNQLTTIITIIFKNPY